MLVTKTALRASMLGAAAFVGLMAANANAQDISSPTTVTDIDQMLLEEGVIEIDLNGGGTDFLVEIVELPVDFPQASAVEFPEFDSITVEPVFPEANFVLPVLEGGEQAVEVALIRAVNEFGGIAVRKSPQDQTPFADTFETGDTVGGDIVTASTALLYFDTVNFFDMHQGELTRSFGPFSETGDNAFVGLSLFSPSSEETRSFVNFGFLEITRGSLTVGQQGFQEQPFEGAQIGAATVPVPAPLALLGFAIAGLFGLRRFKA